MSFDDLMTRVSRRLYRYDKVKDWDAIADMTAFAEAAELWRAAQPVDLGHPTPEEVTRLDSARRTLGWLHFLRYNNLPGDGTELADLTRAILFLAPFADDPSVFPDTLRSMIGPTADHEKQAQMAHIFLSRARKVDDPALVEAAIVMLSAAATTSDGSPYMMMILANLGAAYQLWFGYTGRDPDLDSAIAFSERALAALPNGHALQAAYLSNIAGAYRKRFERGGATTDLNRAITLCEQAIAATPEGSQHRARYLANLAAACHVRFERTGMDVDLIRAADLGQQAVAASADDDPDRANRVTVLANTFQLRFRRTGDIQNLDTAITLAEQANFETPDDHPDRAVRLSNLGNAYRVRFERKNMVEDLNHAIALGEASIAGTNSWDRAMCLNNLGLAYQTWTDQRGRAISAQTLTRLVRQLAETRSSSPRNLLGAGRVIGGLAAGLNDYVTAIQLLDEAVARLPFLTPREIGWEDRENWLGRETGLVSEAIAAHCASDDLGGAVAAAELGRGILLGAQLDSRTELTDLADAEPELATELRRIQVELNRPSGTTGESARTDRDAAYRGELWQRYDQTLAQIRSRPRFSRFLLAPKLSELLTGVPEGAVVLVNAGRRRSDAIIITQNDSPVLVRLTGLTSSDLRSRVIELLDAVQDDSMVSGPSKRLKLIPGILSWLWNTVVGPVLDALPSQAPPGAKLPPHVWWMPVGLLGLLPLHAAGRPDQAGALDRVISSYTPTLRALAYAQARPSATARRQLTVALEYTPDLPHLPGTVAETSDLAEQYPGTTALVDEDATRINVLKALGDATWVHFACHASVDVAAPSRGGLRLHDGTLATLRISQLQLANAELAYLSACSTANRGTTVADECIHLASCFQLAGFRHVIAGLWPLADDVAAHAAHSFYQQLSSAVTADNAAVVLRDVTLQLRDEYPNRPDLWAPLVHSGPGRAADQFHRHQVLLTRDPLPQ